eukprot:gene29062-9513_t
MRGRPAGSPRGGGVMNAAKGSESWAVSWTPVRLLP